MKKFIAILFFALFLSVNAFAHQAFTLVSSEKKTLKANELAALEKNQTAGKKEGTNLIFTAKEIRLVVTTGPEDDMLSYRIQSLRNPTLVVPAGAILKILFINTDTDMRHDVRFGHATGEFPIAPEIAETAGSQKLTARSEDGVLQAEEIVLKAGANGAYKYFCSVRGHAKGGMWGNIAVGIKPGADLKMPEKTEHIHSPDEDKDHSHDEKKNDAQKPATKPDEKSDDHDHGEHSQTDAAKSTQSATQTEKKSEAHRHDEVPMRSSVNLGEPMSRESSGTAWIPDSSPMYAWMKMYSDGSMLMLHGNMFFRYTSIGSSRDVSVGGKGSRSRFDAPSMLMAMYSKPLGEKSQLGLRAMVSLDPIIERGYGYPLLYQSGELYRGEPIHDRQHPHDFIPELSASYSYKFDEKNSIYFYAGYPGEPALGPPTFMHRASGMNNPDAPLSHHWQDATHITYGVVTAGYTHDRFKIEASAFNGTEPDENRWSFDRPKLDSFSARLSFNPTEDWAFQISHGYLKKPERAEPELESIRRTTASAIYNKKFSGDRNLAAAFIWGMNDAEGERTNSFLLEADFKFKRNSIFGRAESVQKSGHELVLDHPDDHEIYRVGAFSAGYVREIYQNKNTSFGLGAMATFNTNPAALVPYYGGTTHQGWQVFFRIRPTASQH